MKKTTIIIIAIVVLAGGFIGYHIFQRTNGTPYELATVQRGELVQEIYTLGKVTPPTTVSLQFKNSGKLTLLRAEVGKKVSAGELLAKQDIAELNAQLAEMQAGIDVQKAKLNQLYAGASAEDIAVAETAVANAETSIANAQQSLNDAKQNLIDKLRDAYTKSDDAIRGKADQFFSNPRSQSPQIFYSLVVDSQLETDVEWARLLLEYNVFPKWKTSIDQLALQSDFKVYLIEARGYLDQIVSFLDKAALVVNSATANSNISQTSLDKWRTDMSTARANVNTAISNLSSAEEKLRTEESDLKTAEGSLKTAQDQLTLEKAPARSPDVALHEAQIRQAEASMQRIEAQIRERTLAAPAKGIIAEVNGEIGETIKPEMVVVRLIPEGVLEINVDVSEADIVNIAVGQEARITLDAFGDEVSWPGKVSHVDPAETLISGAIYYKTTVLFVNHDERIKSGMTANVWIAAERKENALFVPRQAIKERESKKFVEILEGSRVIEKEVTTGMRGTGGIVEILSGLAEGEKIIVGDKKPGNAEQSEAEQENAGGHYIPVH